MKEITTDDLLKFFGEDDKEEIARYLADLINTMAHEDNSARAQDLINELKGE